ncbi:ferritin-like domain-containing protein [Thalassoglobus sp.]|uniref:ferritin-like domain-containing protein n=1 Tax=Thalassoglobus sp. TaxID=2795869 RepID=UPI003AA978C2
MSPTNIHSGQQAMEIREFAERVLLSTELAQKVNAISTEMTDDFPGEAVRVEEPNRPPNLQFAERRAAPRLPSPQSLNDPHKRAVAHHILANHELQALEVMAWTLLAFPDAPSEFRHGLARIMVDEQRHTRMHAERAAKLGVQFGDLPVNCYIWKKAMDFENVLDYLAGLPLVFEGRNLDHTIELETAFNAVGDTRSAHIMRAIHDDEIEHVRFGLEWLRKLKPEELSDWEAFEKHLHWPLRPEKARGEDFQRQARQQAGMTDEFIDRLESAEDTTHKS